VWNRVHRLFALSDREGVDWCHKYLANSLDPLASRDELLGDRGRAASWILLCLEHALNELWDGLKERDPQFLKEVWRTVFGPSADREQPWREVCQWVEDVPNSRLRVLTPEGWFVYRNSVEIEPRVPDSGKDWTLIQSGGEMLHPFIEGILSRGWRGATPSHPK
jgi:hypothetical protein